LWKTRNTRFLGGPWVHQEHQSSKRCVGQKNQKKNKKKEGSDSSSGARKVRDLDQHHRREKWHWDNLLGKKTKIRPQESGGGQLKGHNRFPMQDQSKMEENLAGGGGSLRIGLTTGQKMQRQRRAERCHHSRSRSQFVKIKNPSRGSRTE